VTVHAAQLLLALCASQATAAAPLSSVVGEVVAAPAADGSHLTLRRDRAGELRVDLVPSTVFLQARPGATTLEGATPVLPGAITVGDRVLVQGLLSGDGAALRARRLVVMARSEIQARREAEKEDWRRRGVAGVVTGVDAATGGMTMRVGRPPEARTVTVTTAGRPVVFRRYARDSVRFADARPSSLTEIATGDQVRVLGDRDEAGARVAAEVVVSGAFRLVRGTVAGVDPGKRTVAVDIGTRGARPLSLAVGPDALVRRLPPPMVLRLMRSAGETAPTAGAAPPRAPDPDEALERLPPLALDELRKGEEIAALGPRDGDPAALTAIKLVAWVVPDGLAGDAGRRGRRGNGDGQPDAFTDLLDVGGDSPW
jgi:hypothetical protein